jgi:hypothetical protein
MWLLGLIAGAAAIVLLVFLAPLGIAVIVVVALLRPRPAAAGGVCIAVGVGFLLALWRAADQCAAFSRQPQANCTMGDNTSFALIGALLLGLGLALSAYALTHSNTGPRGQRTQPGVEPTVMDQ